MGPGPFDPFCLRDFIQKVRNIYINILNFTQSKIHYYLELERLDTFTVLLLRCNKKSYKISKNNKKELKKKEKFSKIKEEIY